MTPATLVRWAAENPTHLDPDYEYVHHDPEACRQKLIAAIVVTAFATAAVVLGFVIVALPDQPDRILVPVPAPAPSFNVEPGEVGA